MGGKQVMFTDLIEQDIKQRNMVLRDLFNYTLSDWSLGPLVEGRLQ
jgi:hypothetical protein